MSMYDVSSSLYRDVGCPSQCSSLNEYASVDEMNGINGAVPIPESTAKRFYQTPSSINAQCQVVNPPPPELTKAVQQAAAEVKAAQEKFAFLNNQYIRYNRRY